MMIKHLLKKVLTIPKEYPLTSAVAILSFTLTYFILQAALAPHKADYSPVNLKPTIKATQYESPTPTPTMAAVSLNEVKNLQINRDTLAILNNKELSLVNLDTKEIQKVANFFQLSDQQYSSTWQVEWDENKQHLLITDENNIWLVEPKSSDPVRPIIEQKNKVGAAEILAYPRYFEDILWKPGTNMLTIPLPEEDKLSTYTVSLGGTTKALTLPPQMLPDDPYTLVGGYQVLKWINDHKLFIYRVGSEPYQGIYQIDLNNPSKTKHLVKDFGHGYSAIVRNVAVSPDNKYIFYAKTSDKKPNPLTDSERRTQELYILNVETGVSTLLENRLFPFVESPVWSPDSSKLLVDIGELIVLKIDEDKAMMKQQYDILEKNSSILTYDWNSDGSKLIYSKAGAEWKGSMIYLYDLSSQEKMTIMQNAEYVDWDSSN